MRHGLHRNMRSGQRGLLLPIDRNFVLMRGKSRETNEKQEKQCDNDGFSGIAIFILFFHN